jgi:hypothetical protein
MLYWANWAKAEQNSCVLARQPNEPTKKGRTLSDVLRESPLASVSTVSRGLPSLVFLYSCKIHSPLLGDKVDYGAGLSVVPAHQPI